MRIIGVFVLGLIAGSVLAGDAKTECIKALNEAKKAGLPISPADLNTPNPTAQARRIEKLIDKANNAMRKYQTPMSTIIDIDFKNRERKKKGLPEILYPGRTPAQEAERIKGILAVIEEFGGTTGPRLRSSVSVFRDDFPKAALFKVLVKIELEEMHRTVRKGNEQEVARRLRLTRRLIELVRADSTVVGVLSQQASEQSYYASLLKLAKDQPAMVKAVIADFVLPFQKPTIEQILREEFLRTLSTFDSAINPIKSKSNLKVGNWRFNDDAESLIFLTTFAKSWTLAFKELKACKSGLELENRYKLVAPKLSLSKTKGEDDFVSGPAWADRARALDKAEAKRQETIKALGLG